MAESDAATPLEDPLEAPINPEHRENDEKTLKESIEDLLKMSEEEIEPMAPPEEIEGENVVFKYAKKIGYKLYRVMYATGGFFSDLFGITRPRYEYALIEYERRRQEEAERERELAGDINNDEDEGEKLPDSPETTET